MRSTDGLKIFAFGIAGYWVLCVVLTAPPSFAGDERDGSFATLQKRNSPDRAEPPHLPLWYRWTRPAPDSASDKRQSLAVDFVHVGDGDIGSVWYPRPEDSTRRDQLRLKAKMSPLLKVSGLRLAIEVKSQTAPPPDRLPPFQIGVKLDTGARGELEVAPGDLERFETSKEIFIGFDRPVSANSMEVTLENFRRHRDIRIGIAELTPLPEIYRPTPEATAEQLVELISGTDALKKRRELSQLFMTLDQNYLDALAAQLRASGLKVRKRSLPLFELLPTPEALPMLSRLMFSMRPGTDLYRQLRQALASYNRKVAPYLWRQMEVNRPLPKKHWVDAMHLLGRSQHIGILKKLANRLGTGPEYARQTRISAVSRGKRHLAPVLANLAAEHVGQPKSRDALAALKKAVKRMEPFEKPLAISGVDKHLEYLIRQSSSPSELAPIIRLAASVKLKAFPDLAAQILRESPSREVRIATLEALRGYTGKSRTIHILAENLESQSPPVRIAALETIESVFELRGTPTRLLDAVLNVAATSPNPGVVDAAFAALAETQSLRVQVLVAKLVQPGTEPMRVRIAVTKLRSTDYRLPPVGAKKLLVGATPKETKRAILRALGEQNSPRSLELLKNIVSEQIELTPHSLEQRAALALGRRDTPSGNELIIDLAVDPNQPDVRRRHALRALGLSRRGEVLETVRAHSDELKPEFPNIYREVVFLLEARSTLRRAIDGLGRAINREQGPSR